MKICYVSCSYLFGGIENIIVQTLNELCNSYEVCYILPKGANFLDKFDKRVKIYEYKSYDKRYNLFLFLEISKAIKGYDIVHSHGGKATQILYVLNKFMKFKFVATKHSLGKGAIFNKVKNVISVSNIVAQTIKHDSKVIYFGLKPKKIKKLDLPEIFTICAIGRLVYVKGFDMLINEISKLNFNFRLNIYGEGREKENLQNLINSLGLENKVKIVGFSKNIPEILSSSHLQIISSRKEGLPLTLLEGMFYSNLTIATNAGGISEILDSYFIYDIQNLSGFIEDIYHNYDFFKNQFIKRNIDIRQKINFDVYIDNIISYYRNL
ncbi:glycosyltransferase [Campylobacter ureolyticus]|uniref:glycosyltransferase n=1 Tax=Campylobacter ureolyticus TaxID=827 RepID=UPI002908F42B|nr:glycosyltransferase [Campylobacter ureolyticus]MDU5325709.1 glycosyltransferase [Campylobacter ureolyticus]